MFVSVKDHRPNIGFIELAKHNEVLRAYIISLLTQDVQLTVFTSMWVYRQCYDLHEDENIVWIINEGDDAQAFLSNQNSALESCDAILITTVDTDDGQNVMKTWKSPSAIVIHDVHTTFAYRKYLILDSVRQCLRFMKWIFTGNFKKQSIAVKSHTGYVFPSDIVNDYAQKYIKNKPSAGIPFAINDEISEPQNNDRSHITIPGNIDNKSRDYKVVVEALKNVSLNRIHMTLLGKPKGAYGKMIQKQFSTLTIKGLSLETFDEFIEQSKYDEIMRKTDFLILPMNEEMIFGPLRERNGYSCVSGNINDMVRYGLPAILPRYYPLHKSLSDKLPTYEGSSDLAEIIDKWTKNKAYNEFKTQEGHLAFSSFSKEKTGSKLLDFLFQIKT